MTTGMERVQLLRDLRCPSIKLPSTWRGTDRQTQILRWLLCHDPSKRASPADLLQSELLPSTGRNEAVESVVRLLGAHSLSLS
jgi:translation initiation factor 2-alpha kinase 4